MRQMLRLSTAQIAEICGVSQGTVDRALNGRSDIKAETKQRILDVARRYGYRERIVAEETEAPPGQIGIVVFDLNNEYFTELITELEYRLRAEGLGAVVMMSHYDGSYEIECIRELYNMGVKGIILCSVNGGNEFKNYLKLFDIPMVAIGNDTGALPYVGIDDFAAMRELTLKLIQEGIKKFIYFSPALNYPNAYAQIKRYEGFLNAVGEGDYSVVTDINGIKEHYPEDTAVICSTDYYALKIYFKGCDARLVGFDNISMLDKYNINIDSVGYSVAEIATEAVSALKSNKTSGSVIKHHITERWKG